MVVELAQKRNTGYTHRVVDLILKYCIRTRHESMARQGGKLFRGGDIYKWNVDVDKKAQKSRTCAKSGTHPEIWN